MLCGGVLFYIVNHFGRGFVFGIDFDGQVPYVVLGGILFGFFISIVGIWVDKSLIQRRFSFLFFLALTVLPAILLSCVGIPFVGAAVIARIMSSFCVTKIYSDNSTVLLVFSGGMTSLSVVALPLLGFLSAQPPFWLVT